MPNPARAHALFRGQTGVFRAVADCTAAFKKHTVEVQESMGDHQVLAQLAAKDGRSTNGRTSANLAASTKGLAWLRNTYDELAESPVDLEDVGRVHVLQHEVEQLYRDHLVFLLTEKRVKFTDPEQQAQLDAVRASLANGEGAVGDHYESLQELKLGIHLPACSTFRTWEREGFRIRKIPDELVRAGCTDPGTNRRLKPTTSDPPFGNVIISKHGVHGQHKENSVEADLKAKLAPSKPSSKEHAHLAGKLRDFYRQLKVERVSIERASKMPLMRPDFVTTTMDQTDMNTASIPSTGTRRQPTHFTAAVAGNQYRQSLMIMNTLLPQTEIILLVMTPPHVKPGSNASLTCRLMMYELLEELELELPPNLTHVTDSGSDEVSSTCAGCNALLIKENKAATVTHSRGTVAHNHGRDDQIGSGIKADLQGTATVNGQPTFTPEQSLKIAVDGTAKR